MNQSIQRSKRVLFLSWRDIKHPKKGGAEVYTHEVLKRLVQRGWNIEHYSVLFDDGVRFETIDGVEYHRGGSNATVILHAMAYYYKHANDIDLVVDQCNTHRFFSSLWIPKEKRIFFIHQLTREIWFQVMPGVKGYLGNIMENVLLRLNKNDATITVSASTKCDLVNVGFSSDKVTIAPEGLFFAPWTQEQFCAKESNTFLYAGRISPYKGIEVAIETIAAVKKSGKVVRLWIIGKGDDEYIQNRLLPLIRRLGLSYSEGLGDPRNKDIHFFGFVSSYDLKNLMSRSKALLFASQREGWGLTVSECAVVGTPSIVWPSPGLIDAVNFGQAGYLCAERNTKSMIEEVHRILDNPTEYDTIRQQAYDFACTLSFDTSADVFEQCFTKEIQASMN